MPKKQAVISETPAYKNLMALTTLAAALLVVYTRWKQAERA